MTLPVLHIFGVPMDLGQRRRGVDMGPSAIRYAGLNHRLERLGRTVRDSGNLSTPVAEQIDRKDDDGLMHNVEAVSSVCRSVHERMREVIAEDEIGVFLGGDHSISLGSVSAALARPGRLGVLWIDAHGDFNTPKTTPSGNIHGMVVAALMGLCPPELTISDLRLQSDQIIYIGVRDLDDEEKRALSQSGIRVFTMREIDERGMASILTDALHALRNCHSLHVSLDMDALDPQIAPGVGTPVPGGLTYREAHLCMEMLADDGRVRSLDIVEVNPILDRENQTARLAVDLASSLFGQRIL